jgi:hypothetical protein
MLVMSINVVMCADVGDVCGVGVVQLQTHSNAGSPSCRPAMEKKTVVWDETQQAWTEAEKMKEAVDAIYPFAY